MKVRYMAVLTALAITFFLTGCSGGPESAPAGPRPDWISSPPSDTQDTVYFVGAGSAVGDEAEARRIAANDLVGGITRFFGVRVTAETTAEQRDTLDTFTSEISQTIRETGEAQVGDFRIIESHTERQNNTVSVYLLAAYDRDALEKEQERLRAVFAERVEAISIPEEQGEALLAEGQYYHSAVRFLEAATAAATSTVDNPEIQFERNMNKAREAIRRINLFAVNNNLTTFLRQDFNEPFELKVAAGSSAQADGLADVPIRISFREVRDTGRPRIVNETKVSDRDGMVNFYRPAPNIVGRETFTMGLDFSSPLRSLELVPNRFFSQVEAVERAIREKEVTFTYIVESRAREISTAILVMDIAEDGNPTGRTQSATGMLQALSNERFSVGTVPLDQDLLRRDDAAIVSQIAARHGSRYERLIYGIVRVNDVQERGTRYTARVSGDIRAVDLATGEVLYTSGSRFANALGSNVQAAVDNAFKQFGAEVGEAMVSNLP